MEIKRLAVAGVGRFAGEVVVEGFGPGVNVLAAPNEAGKSTLFRALRTCVFERHKSKKEEVEALRSTGVTVPASITLDFSDDGHDYSIAKTFLRGAGASLVRDGREIAKGAAADEMLWEILGIEPMNRTAIDQAAFAMLWVGQRASFGLPQITKAGETVLGAAIESEVGTMVGSERAKAILAATRVELEKYLTRKAGKAATQGPLAQAQRELDDNRAQLATHAERLRQLEEQFARLEGFRVEQVRLADPLSAAEREAELAQVRSETQAARQAADRLNAAEIEERRAYALFEAAEARQRQLAERAEAIAAAREREAALTGEIDTLGKEVETLREQIAGVKAQLGQFEAADESDMLRDRLLVQLGDGAEKLAAKSEAERRAGLLQAVMGKRRATAAEFDAIKVTAKHVRELETVERELSLIDARLHAAAARLTVKLKAAAGDVTVGGRLVRDGESFAITEALSLSVGDIATLTIAPPEGFGSDQEDARDANTARRSKLLAATGCPSLDAMRETLARRQDCERRLKEIETELSVFGVSADDCEDALAALLRQIAQADAEIVELMKRADVDALPERVSIEEERRAISTRAEERRRNRKALEASVREPQAMLEAANTAKDRRCGELEALRHTLAAHLAVLPDATRDAVLAAAATDTERERVAHRQAAGALGDLRGKTPPAEEIERLGHKLARLEQAAANRSARLSELDRAISNLEGQIQSAGGDGLGERVASIESQLAFLDAEVRRHEKRVAVLALLADTIETALAASRDRFYAPVVQRMKPFLNDVFPGAALELDDGFRVTGIARNGQRAEQFDQLSDGTQEQIAVLARLGLGALLAEQGKPAPIILDDALVFSDDDRIARMFDALIRAGENQQIIVLTCRMRAFEALGGRALRISETPAARN